MLEQSNLFGDDTVKDSIIDTDKYNLMFRIPEEGQYFTQAENFSYSVGKVYNELYNKTNLFAGFYVRRGDVYCSTCDENSYSCECTNKKFDFGEAESMTAYQLERYEILKEEINDLSSGDHTCLDFLYKVFEPVLKTIPDSYGTIFLWDVNNKICKTLEDAVEVYDKSLKAYGRNSMPSFKLVK